jgi:hypothetical protein
MGVWEYGSEEIITNSITNNSYSDILSKIK